ncbi:MAG: hypothetical protein AAF480_01880 [Actinomycetota bacterium]
MTTTAEPLPDFLAQPSRIGTEITVTGKWVPAGRSGTFRTTAESTAMQAEFEALHASAEGHPGVLTSEINHAVGGGAVLVHQVFSDADSMVDHYSTAAADHIAALHAVATPDLHMVRGVELPLVARSAIGSAGVPTAVGELRYGYVRDDYRRPDPDTAVQVTAKWTCTSDDHLDELEYWWQRVGTDAHDIEQGLVRFEAYRVPGEAALVIHETFENSAELKFHLTKGTANRYKKDIDRIAAPEAYYFRGPVAWTIRTYSKFMRLPATYSTRGSAFTAQGGSASDGYLV